jgi:hypothetical protein
MSSLFVKLNLKDHDPIHVLNAPASFEDEVCRLAGVTVKRSIGRSDKVSFALAFARTQAELDALSARLTSAAEGDAVLWVAYPKGTSKKYTCDFNRDTGWHVLGAAGYEAVRMVAIDEDWSALRFRKAEYIRSLKRAPARAMSVEGRRRTARR